MSRTIVRTVCLLCACLASSHVEASDWPMWRHDASRSAENEEQLPNDLALLWTRDLPRLKPAYRTKRLQFDAGYEPVVSGKRLFVGSSFNDRVTAYDTQTGRELWRFYAEGPVRFAPVVWQDRVFFGADDGHVYCLASDDGKLLWKFRAAPTRRRVLGNGRLISLWPVRGGPVLKDGKLYFASGVWSFEGVFVYCLDAKTANVIWRNDDSGNVYGQHPHSAKAMGGVTPQGYLVISGEDLIVPCGQAYPATFDLKTGKLKSFELPKAGRLPGSWFASADIRRGIVTQDKELNSDLHEDKTYQGPGTVGRRSTIRVGDKTMKFADSFPGVSGEVYTMLAADQKLFVVATDGRIHCFGQSKDAGDLLAHALAQAEISSGDSASSERLKTLYESLQGERGYVVIWGVRSYEWLTNLLANTSLHLIVVEPDAKRVATWRRLLDESSQYGQRVALHVGERQSFALPPYLATAMIIDDPERALGASWIEQLSGDLFNPLRPYGGQAFLALSAGEREQLRSELTNPGASQLSIDREGPWTVMRRSGALDGAVNYVGGWSSPDEHIRAPLGVLWFDDTLGHFKRSPQPWFVDGVMISLPKDWMARHRKEREPPYKLLPPVVSDVYTGRIVSPGEPLLAKIELPERDRDAEQPNQYRPPSQKDAWKPKQPIVGRRINPLTGKSEPRAIPKSYGCDGGVDYGLFYTMRSGTPAFYDKRLESGVCNISGPRSGCTNSIIPACGVLNVPYFYEGCTCSYPLPAGLAMTNMPPKHEQWSAWGPADATNIQRVGINFGAPGDRMTEEGTLWLDYPARGGPSPDLKVQVQPDSATYFYRHSAWMRGGDGWPWVAASGVQGAKKIVVSGLTPGQFTVRLSFVEPEANEIGKRVFDVKLNGQAVGSQFDVAAVAKGNMKSVVHETRSIGSEGELIVELIPRAGKTLLSGIEIISD
ncbi:MAG: hypothetical protein CMJ64_08265 [Planctomycetaceae bacterium]|nr:hypothetical protein [Planctomycetaceae bacterium]